MLEGRAGSTLLMQLLGSSPDVCFERVSPFERSYLTYLTRLVGQIGAQRPVYEADEMAEIVYGSNTNIGPLPFRTSWLDTQHLSAASLRAVWQAFAESLAADEPRLYAEKFWGHTDLVIAAGLDPIIIDLVRDPRDVVASIRAFNATTGIPRFGRAECADDHQHLRRLAAGMHMRLATFREDLPTQRFRLRYEDLVRDPQATLAPLAKLCEVVFDVDSVTASRSTQAGHVTSSTAEASIGRWTIDLTEQEVDMIERRLGREMTRLGYALSRAASPGNPGA